MKQGFGKLTSFQDAKELLYTLVKETDNEAIPLENALHRVLAEDIIASIDVPHFRKAAMDGYAVNAVTTFGASNTHPKVLQKNKYIEIVTGAPMPQKMDAVVMVEYTEKYDDTLRCSKAVTPGENVIPVGSDITKGTVLLQKGSQLNPRSIGVLASQRIKKIRVKKKPVIAYFSTGNEILSLNEKLTEGKIFDINSFTIENALLELRCETINLGIVKDEKEAIKKKILEGTEKADFVLLSGGSSLGKRDYIVESVQDLGEVLVHGIAVKPGKPTLIGKVNNKLVLGLPGYPTSALSNFYILVVPLIERMVSRTSKKNTITAPLSKKIVSTIGRYEFLAVKIENKKAVPVQKGSSAITTLAEADGFIEIDENTEVLNKGENVDITLF